MGLVARGDHDELASAEVGVTLEAVGAIPAQVVGNGADQVDEELAGPGPAVRVRTLHPLIGVRQWRVAVGWCGV